MRRAVRAVCAVVSLAAATGALICALLLADDSERWLRALLWLVLVATVGAVAGILLAVTGRDRERVR